MNAADVCPPEVHEAIKRDEAAWSALPFPRGGHGMETYDDAPGAPQWLETRNCTCNSTLYKPMATKPNYGGAR